jgi:hypothetical protein
MRIDLTRPGAAQGPGRRPAECCPARNAPAPGRVLPARNLAAPRPRTAPPGTSPAVRPPSPGTSPRPAQDCPARNLAGCPGQPSPPEPRRARTRAAPPGTSAAVRPGPSHPQRPSAPQCPAPGRRLASAGPCRACGFGRVREGRGRPNAAIVWHATVRSRPWPRQAGVLPLGVMRCISVFPVGGRADPAVAPGRNQVSVRITWPWLLSDTGAVTEMPRRPATEGSRRWLRAARSGTAMLDTARSTGGIAGGRA